MTTIPGYLAVGGVEVANNQRVAAYLAAGLNTPQFEIISRDGCEALTNMAFPLEVCDGLADAYDNQFYANPLPTYRVPNTGALGVPLFRWFEAGYWGIIAASQTGAGIGVVLPNAGTVEQTVRVTFDVLSRGSVPRSFYCGKMVQVGTANVGWLGIGLLLNAGTWSLCWERRIPNVGAGSLSSQTLVTLGDLGIPGNGTAGNRNFTLELVFGTTAVTATIYGQEPHQNADHVQLAPVVATAVYGYDANPISSWAAATGQTEAAQMATATEVGIFANSIGFFPSTEVVFSEVAVLPGPQCDEHSLNTIGLTYPSPAAIPNPLFYPSTYRHFVNPTDDLAPWIDFDQLEVSSGFYGMLLTDVEGLDTTETRSLDPAATGIGGILGPVQLQPRELTFKGYLIASGAASMMYARRWLAQTLGGALCPGCSSNYVDVLPTCGAPELTQSEGGILILPADARRLYGAGLLEFTLDTDDPVSCDYVLPVTFKLGLSDPYLYTLPDEVIPVQALNPSGADSPAVPFETWLFGAAPPDPICVDLEAPALGIDAAIITVQGGLTGLTGALVYPSRGLYPSPAIYPSTCAFPCDDLPLWDITTCPFVFNIETLGPGELFTVDSSRRRIVWTLAGGTEVNGAPLLGLAPGQVIQWIDTCAGDDLQACVQAFSNCTCDETAVVTVATQHRER